jgi:hypothetical protein
MIFCISMNTSGRKKKCVMRDVRVGPTGETIAELVRVSIDFKEDRTAEREEGRFCPGPPLAKDAAGRA